MRRCGASIAGSARSFLGRVRDLRVTPVGYDGAALEWDLDQAQPIDARAAVYCDGRLQALGPANVPAAVGSLGSGTHTLRVRLAGVDAITPSRVWTLGAQRAWIRWTPVAVPDLAAYVVQEYQAAAWVDVAEVTRFAIGEIHGARPATGTGPGRLTVFGTLNDAELSGVISIIVSASDLQLWHDGVLIESQEIVPFATLLFGSGVRVYVLDRVEDYHAGDTWTTPAGIETDWQSGELAAGDHLYRVLARDRVGNLSILPDEPAITIQELPERAQEPGFVVTEEPGGFHVELRLSHLPIDSSTVEVYSNYNAVLNRFEDYVYTRAPLAILEDAEQIILQDVPAGLLKAYLWTRKDGVLRDDVTLYTLNLPPTPEDQAIALGPVFSLGLSYLPDGTPVVAWTYDFGPAGADCTSFDLLVQINNEAADWHSALNLPTDENIDQQSGVFVTYRHVGSGAAATGDTLYCWIRARSDVYGITGPEASASAEVDIDAPPSPLVSLAMPS